MLKVLIIEDTDKKARDIKEYVRSLGCEVKVVSETREAIAIMISDLYDLVLLDLYIPEEFGDEAEPDNAYNLLQRVSKDRRIRKPVAICGITRFDNIEEAERRFKDYLWSLIKYEENSITWKAQVRGKIEYLKNVSKMKSQQNSYDYDVAIITALQKIESEQLRNVFGGNWEAIVLDDDDTTTYYTTELSLSSGDTIRIVTCYQQLMAGTASAMLTTKVIANFRPRYLFMTGIAASVKTADEGVGYGDVLVATEVWNAANGKIKETESDPHLFMPDYRHEVLDAAFENIITKLMEEKQLLYDISEAFPSESGKPNTKLRIHKGPMASVPAVIACADVVNDLKKHDRSLLGIEMEAYGLFYAAAKGFKPRPIYTASLKSVSDYGTKEKCDKYQEYAAYTSAAVLKHIIENYLKYD